MNGYKSARNIIPIVITTMTFIGIVTLVQQFWLYGSVLFAGLVILLTTFFAAFATHMIWPVARDIKACMFAGLLPTIIYSLIVYYVEVDWATHISSPEDQVLSKFIILWIYVPYGMFMYFMIGFLSWLGTHFGMKLQENTPQRDTLGVG